MSRPGAFLIPLLGGFLSTVAAVSWRSGWWQPSDALESPAAAPSRIELWKFARRAKPDGN